MEGLKVVGAYENNLKKISVEIPHQKLTVLTGVSGSGKTSLAFEVIMKEGMRYYLESLSTYARHYFNKTSRPLVNQITGQKATLPLRQKNIHPQIRSTVSTLTQISDHLRMLFSRLGEEDGVNVSFKYSSSDFSFNTDKGACPTCKGWGVEDILDVNKIVADPAKSLREKALVPTQPNGYIMYSQVTMETMKQIADVHDFSIDTPWKDLTIDQQNVVLYGSKKIKVLYGKHSLESRLKWKGISAKPRKEGYYLGIMTVMNDILKRDRNPSILRFVTTRPCGYCHGSRLNPEIFNVKVQGVSFPELERLSLFEVHNLFKSWTWNKEQQELVKSILSPLDDKILGLISLGLGHLPLNRPSKGISRGELQRLQLSLQLGSPLSGLLYVLDEPTAGLHPQEAQKVGEQIYQLVKNGNTVVVVEHNPIIWAMADYRIELGPGGGTEGGEVIYSGPADQYPKDIEIDEKERSFKEISGEVNFIKLNNISKNNLHNLSIQLLEGGINVVSGMSGAGKTSLLEWLSEQFPKANWPSSSPIGRSSRSNPATYTKLFDKIRDLYSSLEESKELNFSKGRFSFNNKEGLCSHCQGLGVEQIGLSFLENIYYKCSSCQGKRFNQETLKIKYLGLSISDVLDLTISDALIHFKELPSLVKSLEVLSKIGLAYLTLGRPTPTLSGGEALRLKLAAQLIKQGNSKSQIFLLDEPTIGLHYRDLKGPISAIQDLVKLKHTVIVASNRRELLEQANYVIELGPESGPYGGKVVSSGTLNQVLKDNESRATKIIFDSISPSTRDSDKLLKKAPTEILMKGVSTHNLKNIDVKIPYNKISVITGVSGSGKSSLAFDSLYAEGERLFTEGISPFARRFLEHKTRGKWEEISGLKATIGINEDHSTRNHRSTIATSTDLLEYLRLIYSRLGSPKGFRASAFSFNHPDGACQECTGLGYTLGPDEGKLISHPDRPLFNGAMVGHPRGKFYGDPEAKFHRIVKVIGNEKNLDFSKPWNELNCEEKKIALKGTEDQKVYSVSWEIERGKEKKVHQFESSWPGLLNYLIDDFKNQIGKVDALMSKIPCKNCQGERIQRESAAVKVGKIRLPEFLSMNIKEALQTIEDWKKLIGESKELIKLHSLLEHVKERLDALDEVGLSYINLNRPVDTLSGGEFRRLRLASLVRSSLNDAIYIIDEPTTGLHSQDIKKLIKLMKKWVERNNTLVIVEHNLDVIKASDYLIELGPGAGVEGGKVIVKGAMTTALKDKNSITGKYLDSGRNGHNFSVIQRTDKSAEQLKVIVKIANAHNLKGFDLTIPLSGMVAITGVSGSGKSAFLFNVLHASFKHKRAKGCEDIEGLDQFYVHALNNKYSPPNSAYSVASMTGILDPLTKHYAQEEVAKQAGLKTQDFSHLSNRGQCSNCKGKGYTLSGLDFLPDVEIKCQQCDGKRLKGKALDISWRGKRLDEIFEMTLNQFNRFIRSGVGEMNPKNELAQLAELYKDIGLGHLILGQKGTDLSCGEKSRLQLAKHLIDSKKVKKNRAIMPALFLWDEPERGLHIDDLKYLYELINRIVQNGDIIIVSTHSRELMSWSNFIVKLGPEGGPAGGYLLD